MHGGRRRGRAVVGGPGCEMGGQTGAGSVGRWLEERHVLQTEVFVQEGGGQRVLLEREEAHLRERGGGGVLVVVRQRAAGTARDGRF